MRGISISLIAIIAVIVSGYGLCPAGIPCDGTSDTWAETDSAVAGDTVGVYVIIRDCYGTPLADMLCDFYTDRGEDDVVIGSPALTDLTGFAEAEITTVVPGESRIYVECEETIVGPSSPIAWAERVYPVRGDLWGDINGTDFTAQVSGTVNTTTGFLCVDVTFDETPGFCPLWQLSCLACVVCCNGAKPIDEGVSLLELSGWDYSLERTLYYPTGDSLWTSASVWLSGDTVRYEAEWHGNYLGPTDLVEIPPYNQIMRPAGPGKIDFTGVGDVAQSGGGWIQVTWQGSYDLPNNAELPFAEVSTIDHACTWDGIVYHVEGYSTVEPLPTCLLNVSCILGGDSSHAVVYREGQEYPISGVQCLTAGDVMKTYSDRILLTDADDHDFCIGSNTITRYGLYSCLEEDYAIYLNLGEIYGAHRCVKIRSSCWARYQEPSLPYFVRQDPGSTSHYFALAGSLTVAEYYPGCVDSLLFTVNEGMHATTIGHVEDSSYAVTFQPISYADSAYIIQTYVDDWASVEEEPGLPVPSGFSLAQNCPNPYNPITEIRYSLPMACHVRLEIFNGRGQKTATLVEGYQDAGYKSIRWDSRTADGGRLCSGVYFCRLEAAGHVEVKKMVLLK